MEDFISSFHKLRRHILLTDRFNPISDDIKHLLTIKTKMSYVIYASKMHTLKDAETILDKLSEYDTFNLTTVKQTSE